MRAFIVRRLILIIPLLFLISVISFATILLPPGSYVETYVQNLERTGFIVDQGQIEAIYKQYGLDQPAVLQYVLWMSNFLLKRRNGTLLYLPTTREGRYHGTSTHVSDHRLSLFDPHLADSYPYRHLLRAKAVFGGGLHRHRHRLYRGWLYPTSC